MPSAVSANSFGKNDWMIGQAEVLGGGIALAMSCTWQFLNVGVLDLAPTHSA